MKTKKKITQSRIASFRHAISGLKVFFKAELHAKIHGICAILVIVAAFLFDISYYEWVAILMAIGLVFVSEILNTSIEHISDFVCAERNEKIKVVKDLAAAAVLVAAAVAFIIGIVIFFPKLFALTNSVLKLVQ